MDAVAFLDRFPQFGDVEAATIDVWLADAAAFVTSEYGADQERATALYAAHMMSLGGIGPEAAAAAFVGLKSINSGSLSFTINDKLGDWGLTSFGRQFYPIYKSVRGGFLVTGTGDLDIQNGPYAWHGSNAGPLSGA
jgi:hypothetical protein